MKNLCIKFVLKLNDIKRVSRYFVYIEIDYCIEMDMIVLRFWYDVSVMNKGYNVLENEK